MKNYNFELRLNCTYTDPDNRIDQLDVEVLVDDQWQTLQLNTETGGFLLFTYALFSCQHRYFRANAAESGLMLTSAEGRLSVQTDTDWKIEKTHVSFTGVLKRGMPTQEAIDYITERMQHCPVSSNLAQVNDRQREVHFVHA